MSTRTGDSSDADSTYIDENFKRTHQVPLLDEDTPYTVPEEAATVNNQYQSPTANNPETPFEITQSQTQRKTRLEKFARFEFPGGWKIIVLLFIVIIVNIFILITVFVILAVVLHSMAKSRKHRLLSDSTILLISIDGFRWDYFDKYDAPRLKKDIIEKGFRADQMRPIYPSKTFPNHYSIVTGLYSESHGIVSNTMYDPEFDAQFSLGSPESFRKRWWKGEPIWITAKNQKVPSAAIFWPGSEVESMHPTYYEKYDESITHEKRIQILMEHLERPKKERPRIICMYFSEVDTAGHEFGPDSDQVASAIRIVDDTIGKIIDQLKERSLDKKVDMLVVSDHGMSSISPSKTIRLDNYVDLTSADLKVLNYGPLTDVHVAPFGAPSESRIDSLFNQLSGKSSEWSIYRREDIPESYHYRKSLRIPDILLDSKLGWSIEPSDKFWGRGNHGWDNNYDDMKAICIGVGPHLRTDGATISGFDNIHLYELISYLLQITPSPNNGTLSKISHVIAPEFSP